MKPSRKRIVIQAIVISWLCTLGARAQSPSIRTVIDEVNLDSLVNTVKVLSGETGSTANGTSDTIFSRDYSVPGHVLAMNYLKSRFESYALSTQLQPYVKQSLGISGTNILAEQRGKTLPGRKYILCAHYDSGSDTTALAPGADDNASGCAAVLEAARLLSRYDIAYTVVYALWDEEEIGPLGSDYYAKDAAARGDTILGVVNLEMFGWDSDGDNLIDIHTSPIANSVQLADTVKQIVQTYGLGLHPIIYNPGTSGSDHASFWRRGYTAIVFGEAFSGGDFNPYDHHTGDLLQHFNLPYFHRLAQLAAGSIAFLSDVQATASVVPSPSAPASLQLAQNFPNPFNPRTIIRYFLPERTRVELSVHNILGQRVALLEQGVCEAGEHRVEFNGTGLASGIYFYRLQAGQNNLTRAMVLLK